MRDGDKKKKIESFRSSHLLETEKENRSQATEATREEEATGATIRKVRCTRWVRA